MDAVPGADVFRLFIEIAVMILEAAAAIIILGAGARALYRYSASAISQRKESGDTSRLGAASTIQLEFGRALLLAFDFTIGSGVLKFSITSTLQDASVAAVVAGVRVVLTFVLRSELAKAPA